MPPTRWKQEEEEGKENHRQTLNSLTPPDCKWLLSPSRTAGILLPFPLILKQPIFSCIPQGPAASPDGQGVGLSARNRMTARHFQVKVTQPPALPRVLS